MAKGEVPSPPEQEGEEECLHCAIVALVEARIASGGADAADLAALIVESLVGTVRNLVCGAIVTPTEGAYGDQERHPGPASGRP